MFFNRAQCVILGKGHLTFKGEGAGFKKKFHSPYTFVRLHYRNKFPERCKKNNQSDLAVFNRKFW